MLALVDGDKEIDYPFLRILRILFESRCGLGRVLNKTLTSVIFFEGLEQCVANPPTVGNIALLESDYRPNNLL